MRYPTPAYPFRCNAVGPMCGKPAVARVVTRATNGQRFADDVCMPHLTGAGGYLDRVVYARDPLIEAIIPLPLGEEEDR